MRKACPTKSHSNREMKTILTIFIVLAFALGVNSAQADVVWTTIDMPGANCTNPRGIDGSNIVGIYDTTAWGNPHGFLYDGKTWTTLDMPGATEGIMVCGISGNNIIGWYVTASDNYSHGFLYNYNEKIWTTLDFPGVTDTYLCGIDGSNIVGWYYHDSWDNGIPFGIHGFLYDGNTWTTLDMPGIQGTEGSGISGNNIIGGYFGVFSWQSFLYDGTTWTTLDIPIPSRPINTYQYIDTSGISGHNIVGSYTDASNHGHGFLYNYNGHALTTLDFPGAYWTVASGISGNNIIGYYEYAGQENAHGFLCTISESPSTSTDATLSNLTVNGITVTDFSPSIIKYNVVLPLGTTKIPMVAATTNNPNATDIITQATSLPGSATVVVMAEDGITNENYKINFTVVPMTGTWTTFSIPGAFGDAYPYGIDGNNIVGCYNLSGQHGFLYNGTTLTTFDAPGATITEAYGISGNNIVGYYYDVSGHHGFLYNGTIWTTLDFPGATCTEACGISGNNIVGWYVDASGTWWHGFLYNGTTWTTLDFPGAQTTWSYGISGNNIVGKYGGGHSFLYDGTTWTMLDFPEAIDTEAYGISGINIVGKYGGGHGFLYNGTTTWTTLDMPGAIDTYPYGISGSNIVGIYHDASGGMHGFLYTIPKPMSAVTTKWWNYD